MRAITVTYFDPKAGEMFDQHTNITGTDNDIFNYFKIGTPFNVGRGEHDYICTVYRVIIHPSAQIVARMNGYLYWIGKGQAGESWYNITPKEQEAPHGGYLLPETICKIKNVPNLFGDIYK
jgi:hypothetical protein